MLNKPLILFLACALACGLTACNANTAPPPAPIEEPAPTPEPAPQETKQEPFKGKIAIITYAANQNTEYYTPQPVIAKYGAGKIIHATWPDSWFHDPDGVMQVVEKLGADPEIKAIVVNRPVFATNPAFKKLRETRDDIFIIYCGFGDHLGDSTGDDIIQTADLVLDIDWLGMGPAMVRQAQKLGAKTFVYYPDQRSGYSYINGGLIKQTCDELGIEFVELE